jgi:protein-L-isoaspartate(D-aspartate) O-methyltransferase
MSKKSHDMVKPQGFFTNVTRQPRPSSAAASAGLGLTSERQRQRMVEQLQVWGIRHPRVLAAMMAVPRHQFVDAGLASRAYENDALPIGHGQTISQPYIVAKMMELALEPPGAKHSPHRWLEIGTGCGYQAAVMAQLASQVLSIERLRPLYERALENLAALDIDNLWTYYGDGLLGLVNHAPFDAIVVAAAGLSIPPHLTQQLAIGGRLIIPVQQQTEQNLMVIHRQTRDSYVRHTVARVRFVPLLPGVVEKAG